MPDSQSLFFLSHSSRDKEIVEQLAEGLLEREGIHCWIDIWAIPAASDWEAEIEKALDSCVAAIVVLGQYGWGPYHLAEARLALERHKRSPEFVVVPVLLPGATQEDKDRLEGFFDETQNVTFAIGEGESKGELESEATRRIAAALGAAAPFPLGRSRMSPYTIRRDARRWIASGAKKRRDPSILYRGRTLVRARELATQYPGQMDTAALELLQASEAAERARSRTRLTAAFVLSGVFAGLAGVAWWLKGVADANARDARANSLANLAKVVREDDATRALRIAELAYELNPNLPAVQQALLEIFYRDRWGRARDEKLPIRALAVSADGQRIAAGGYGPNITIRDASDGLVAQIDVGSRHVTAAAFSPDGSHVLIGTYERGARLYTASGTFVRALGQEDGTVFTVAFSKDGRSAFIAGLRGGLIRYSVEGQEEARYPGSDDNIQIVAISGDGTRVAAGFFGGETRIWPTDNSGPPTTLMQGPRGWGAVRGVAFAGSGNRVVTGHDDGTLAVWDVNGALVHRVQAHDGTIWGLALGPVSQASSTIVTLGYDRRAAIWDLPNNDHQLAKVRQPRVRLHGHLDWVTAGAFTPDGDVYTASTDGVVRRWFIGEGISSPLGNPKDYFAYAAFHPSEPWLLMNKGYGSVLVDLQGRPVREFTPAPPEQPMVPSADGRGFFSLLGPVSQGVFSSDGTVIATGHHDRQVRLWSVTGAPGAGPLRTLPAGDAPIKAVCLRTTAPRILAGNEKGVVFAWEAEGESAREFARLPGPITGIAASPDGSQITITAGNYFATSNDSGQTVRVFASNGTQIREWTSQSEQLGRPAYRTQGDLVLPGNSLKLQDQADAPPRASGYQVYTFDRDGRLRRMFGGHEERVRAVAISRDDRHLLTASGIPNTDLAGGDAAKLWDFEGNLLFEIFAGSPVVDVSFSADGSYFVTVEDHAVRLWRTPKGIVEWLSRSRVDPLTPEERASLLQSGGLS